MMDRELSDRRLLRSVSGILYAFTTVYSGPVGIETPYPLGWVDTDGERVFARIVGTPRLGSAGTLTWINHEGWWFECAP